MTQNRSTNDSILFHPSCYFGCNIASFDRDLTLFDSAYILNVSFNSGVNQRSLDSINKANLVTLPCKKLLDLVIRLLSTLNRPCDSTLNRSANDSSLFHP